MLLDLRREKVEISGNVKDSPRKKMDGWLKWSIEIPGQVYQITFDGKRIDLLPPNRHYIIIFHSAIYSSIDKFIDTTMPVTLQSSTT